MDRPSKLDLSLLIARAVELEAINRESTLAFTAIQIQVGITFVRIADTDFAVADQFQATRALAKARRALDQATKRTSKLAAQGEDVQRLQGPLAELRRAVEKLEHFKRQSQQIAS